MLQLFRRLRYQKNLMHWTAPSEKDTATETIKKRLWDAAGECRMSIAECRIWTARPADSRRTSRFEPRISSVRSGSTLVFLRFAEVRFAAKLAQLESPSPIGWEMGCG